MDVRSSLNDPVQPEPNIPRNVNVSRTDRDRENLRAILRVAGNISIVRKFFRSGETFLVTLILIHGIVTSINDNMLSFGRGWNQLNLWLNGQGMYFSAMSYFLFWAAIFCWYSEDDSFTLALWGLNTIYWTVIWLSFLAAGTVTVGVGLYGAAMIWSFGMFFFGILEQGVVNAGEASE